MTEGTPSGIVQLVSVKTVHWWRDDDGCGLVLRQTTRQWTTYFALSFVGALLSPTVAHLFLACINVTASMLKFWQAAFGTIVVLWLGAMCFTAVCATIAGRRGSKRQP